jgi:phosphomannomutase
MTKFGCINPMVDSIDETVGLRVSFEDENIIHLRPSGNAPELLCYGEAKNFSTANKIVVTTLSKIIKLDTNLNT